MKIPTAVVQDIQPNRKIFKRPHLISKENESIVERYNDIMQRQLEAETLLCDEQNEDVGAKRRKIADEESIDFVVGRKENTNSNCTYDANQFVSLEKNNELPSFLNPRVILYDVNESRFNRK